MDFSPFIGDYLVSPAACWQELLDSNKSVVYAEDLGLWLIFRHEHVRRAFADSDSFGNELTLAPISKICPEAGELLAKIDAPPTTAAADAPVHTRTRRSLRATFATTPDGIEQEYGTIIQRRVEELTDALATRSAGIVDLVPAFTARLPLMVIMDILGVPEGDHERLRGWADGQIALIWGCVDSAEQVRLAHGLLEFWRYCQRLVAECLHGGDGTNLIQKLLRFRGGDDSVLTEAEVASIAFNLLVAGHETTAGLLAHGLAYMLAVPGSWQRIANDETYTALAVEEILRFAPAIDGWLRVTRRPVAVGGVTIPAGARCLLLIGAANRDGTAFLDPTRFDPNRADGKNHLAFGYGPHFCIGAALARLETRVALTRLSGRLPALRLAPEHVTEYHPNVAFRTHRSLLVSL